MISGLLASLLLLWSLSAKGDEPDLVDPVPDRVVFTVQKSPVLYYWISHATSLPVRFALVEQRQIRPRIEITLESPTRPGFWGIRLKDYNIVLEEDVQYRWFVSVIRNPDSRSTDIVAGGVIERVDPRLVDYYGHGCDQDSVLQAEKAGLWIDAFACVNELIETHPKDDSLRGLRERLLRQERSQSNKLLEPPLCRRSGCPPVC